MSWAADLERLASKGGKDLGKLAMAIKIELFSGIVEQTRVDTGRLKGNWQIQNNKLNPSDNADFDATDLGGLNAASESKIERGSLASSKTYFTNHLPYAKTYENIDGMVGRSVARVRQIVKDEVKALR